MVYGAVGTMNCVLVEDRSVSGNRTPGDKVLKDICAWRVSDRRGKRTDQDPIGCIHRLELRLGGGCKLKQTPGNKTAVSEVLIDDIATLGS